MTKSLLLNFLELIGLISKNPKYVFEKIEQIRIILINLHHLLNSYRLHQSRESLILKYEEKIADTLATIDNIEKTCDAVEKKIKMSTVPDDMQLNTNTNTNTDTTTANASTGGAGAENQAGADHNMDMDVMESTSMDDKVIERLKKEAVKNLTDALTNQGAA
ncbi:unnamed protein product [Ambrosiozyma monospora]|uniref:Unnamed protein product n=1 Tax=Ambrosiozyma monospora TaxID=43982 RepID=A0ACB5UCQ0_AMBMO|nr:unnamed protein product [Ambrosiozyma monospora]